MSSNHHNQYKSFDNKKNKKGNDKEENICPNNNIHNYKGIFYDDHEERKYFEYGAHFEYSDLCRRLIYLRKEIQSTEEINESNKLLISFN